MRERNADVREGFNLFQSQRKAAIVRLSRRENFGRKFKRMGESRSSSSPLNITLYLSLRIYFTTSGLLLSSLMNPFLEDARTEVAL